MTYEQYKSSLEPVDIVLGIGYATALLVLIGWIITLLI
jgi:hypothetical protein